MDSVPGADAVVSELSRHGLVQLEETRRDDNRNPGRWFFGGQSMLDPLDTDAENRIFVSRQDQRRPCVVVCRVVLRRGIFRGRTQQLHRFRLDLEPGRATVPRTRASVRAACSCSGANFGAGLNFDADQAADLRR